MANYGALDNRPKSTVLIGTIVGALIVVGILGGIFYLQYSERRRLDDLDYETLNAELASLEAVAAHLEKLSQAAVPETDPKAFDTMLADARKAYDEYMARLAPPRALPSGRPWPSQFATARELAGESLESFRLTSYYLSERAKMPKSTRPDEYIDIDTNIKNVSDIAREPLEKLNALLEEMRAQRENRSWRYD